MKKRIVCMAVCLTMLITAGCGNSAETVVSQAQELSTSEGSGEKSDEKLEEKEKRFIDRRKVREENAKFVENGKTAIKKFLKK